MWEEEESRYGLFKNRAIQCARDLMQPIITHLALLKPDNNLFMQKPQHTIQTEPISDVMNRDADELIKGVRFGGCLGTSEPDLLPKKEAYAGLDG